MIAEGVRRCIPATIKKRYSTIIDQFSSIVAGSNDCHSTSIRVCNFAARSK
jgi:hypothetical protein